MNPNFIVMKKGYFSFLSERKTARENFRLTFTQTYILSILALAFLGIYYVWILNVNATKGYNIRNLELDRRNLTVQKNLLDIKIAEAESLEVITTSPSNKSMEAEEAPKYFVLKDINMALLTPDTSDENTIESNTIVE